MPPAAMEGGLTFFGTSPGEVYLGYSEDVTFNQVVVGSSPTGLTKQNQALSGGSINRGKELGVQRGCTDPTVPETTAYPRT